MTGHLKAHGKQMLVAGVAVMAVAVVLGAGWRQAVTWGLLLACPVGMLAMMWVMGRQMSGGHARGAADEHHEGCHGHATDLSQPFVTDPVAAEPRREA